MHREHQVRSVHGVSDSSCINVVHALVARKYAGALQRGGSRLLTSSNLRSAYAHATLQLLQQRTAALHSKVITANIEQYLSSADHCTCKCAAVLLPMPWPVCAGNPEAIYASPEPPKAAAGAGAGVCCGCIPGKSPACVHVGRITF
eukprot:15699-Heterococcus_DN1.PRE.2